MIENDVKRGIIDANDEKIYRSRCACVPAAPGVGRGSTANARTIQFFGSLGLGV